MRTHNTVGSGSAIWTAVWRYCVRSFDFSQGIPTLLLLAIGVLFIHTTGVQTMQGEGISPFAERQLYWIGAGLTVYCGAVWIDYRKYMAWTAIFYLITIFLLIYVLGFGVLLYGARRWIDLGSFRLQPSEPAKFALILFLSALCSLPSFAIDRFGSLVLAGVLVLVPFLLVAYEPDLGSAMVFLPISAAILFGFGLRLKTILLLCSLLLVMGALLVANEVFQVRPLLREYQKNRIRTFFNPGKNRLKTGYNQYQARLAVGSGGVAGKGIGHGTQHVLGFLPRTVVNNDFIFSVIAEEWGFLGCLGLLSLYGWLLYAILRTAWLAVDRFGRGIALGVGTMIFFHMFVNIGMSVGLTPVTGLPLPLVSYGGSFILVALAALGSVQSVYRIGMRSRR